MQADALRYEERVLVVAPTKRDAQISQALFDQAGISCAICHDLATFSAELERGVGAVVMTEGALAPERRRFLLAPLAAQPIWSDLPIILLTSSEPSQVLSTPLVRYLGNVLVLERPVSTRTLLSIVQMALRTRRRQQVARIVTEAGLLLADMRAGDLDLTAVVDLLVPQIADCCLLYTLDAGTARLTAMAFADTARPVDLGLRDAGASAGRGERGARAAQTALSEEAQALASATALAEAHLQMIGAVEQRVVPLQTPAGALGVLSVAMLIKGRSFAPENNQAVLALASRVTLALDQARLYRALQDAHGTLEARVQERTAALAAANQVLQEEITQRRRAERERAELLERVLSVQEEERQRIARDLHDQLGQQITGLLLGLKQLEQRDYGTSSVKLILPLQALAEQMARETHRIAIALRPTALDDLGLTPALERLVAQWSEQAAIPASFIAVGLDGTRLAPPIETAIYRVVQEALTNAGKYSQAQIVSVVVQRHRSLVQTIIEDDGCGFAADAPAVGDGRPRLGLLGMRERVTQVGGTLDIESAPGSGTTISVRIPLDGRGEH